MTDDYRSTDSFTRDIEGATPESIERGLDAVARRRRERQDQRDEYWASDRTSGAVDARDAYQLNRAAALRGPVSIDGSDHWWAVCVCRWQSLRLKDPEAVLCEYDRHPCSIPVEDDAPARAQAALKNTTLVEREDGTIGIAKRPLSTLIPALASQRTEADEKALRGVYEERPSQTTTKQSEDEASARFALLELK